MTCVVAAVIDGVAVMGADSQSSSSWTKYTSITDKIFQLSDGVVFGGSGSWRELNVIKHSLQWGCFSGYDIEKYVITEFVPSLRSCIRDSGAMKTENGRDEASGAYLLVVRDRIFRIDTDLQAIEISLPFAAVGSGECVAMGAMFIAEKSGHRAMMVADAGLSAASELAVGVGGPFRYLEYPVKRGE